MGFDHGADGGFVFHPDRCTGTNHEEIPANPTELKGAPKLEPVCGLALIETAHGLGVEGQRLLWHHHPTTQEACHMEEEGGAVRMDVLPCPPDVPGHPMDIIIEQDIEILPDLVNLRKGFVPELVEQSLRVLRILPITKQVCPRPGFDSFDIDTRHKVSKEGHVLLYIHPDFMD